MYRGNNMSKKRKSFILLSACFLALIAAALLSFSPYSADENRTAGDGATVYYSLVLTDFTVPAAEDIVGITDPNGRVSELTDGKLFPTIAGDYILEYGSYKAVLRTLRDYPEATFEYSAAPPEGLKTGDVFVIPSAHIESILGVYNSYNVTVSRGDEVIAEVHSSKLNGYSLTIPGGGKYTVTYSATDSTALHYTVSDSFEFEAEEVTAVVMNSLPSSVYYGEPINLGAVYGLAEGNTYPAMLTVQLPSGLSESFSDIIYYPSVPGDYIFTASAEIGGNVYTRRQEVSVLVSATSLISNTLAIENVQAGVSLPDYSYESGSALFVQAQGSNSEFTYSEIIDLRDLSAEIPIIEFIPYSDSNTGTSDDIRVTLTDIHDPSKTLSVYWWYRNATSSQSYMSVYVSGSEYGGINNETGSSTYGQVRTNYGTVAWDCYFNAYNRSLRSRMFNISYDCDENAVYSELNGNLQKVIDLDDPALIGYSRVWDGFTTGEVYLTVEFTRTQQALGVYLVSAGGRLLDFELLENPVNEQCFAVDWEGELPDGAVGYEYSFPQYTVHADLNVEVDVSVYSGDEKQECAETGFVPKEAGDYTLIYSATDNYGSPVEKRFEFTVAETPTPFSTDLPDEDSAELFSYYTIPNYTVRGGSGEISASVEVLCGGKAVPEVSGAYYIDRAEDYEVRITFTDYIGYTETVSYALKPVKDYVSLIPENDILAVRAGTTVTFPSFETHDYLNDTDPEKTVELISGGVVIKTFTGDGPYEFTVPADLADLTVKYWSGKGTDREKVKEYPLEILPAEFSSIYDFLIFDENSVVPLALREGMMFTADSEFDVTFPNPIPVADLQLGFGVDSDRLGFEALIVTFTDASDPSFKVTFRFYDFNSNGTVKAETNGDGREYSFEFAKNIFSSRCHSDEDIIEQYAGRTYYYIETMFDAALNKLNDLNGKEITSVSSLENGREFTGFPSGLVYVSIGIEGVTDTSRIMIGQAANQQLNRTVESAGFTDSDNAGPAFLFDSQMTGLRAEFGSEITVSSARAFDLIQPESSEVSVTVTAPDGTVLHSGALAESMNITLSQYGVWRIVYTAEDSLGNTASRSFNVTVADREPPDITVNGEIGASFNRGDAITIPAAEVTDNLAGAGDVTIYIKTPDARYYKTVAGANYTFEEAGSYLIVYSAADAEGNVQRITFTVNVK